MEKIKKVIVTIYLTIQNFFLRIAKNFHNSEFASYNKAISPKKPWFTVEGCIGFGLPRDPVLPLLLAGVGGQKTHEVEKKIKPAVYLTKSRQVRYLETILNCH